MERDSETQLQVVVMLMVRILYYTLIKYKHGFLNVNLGEDPGSKERGFLGFEGWIHVDQIKGLFKEFGKNIPPPPPLDPPLGPINYARLIRTCMATLLMPNVELCQTATFNISQMYVDIIRIWTYANL